MELLPVEDGVLRFVRSGGDERVLVALNFSGEERALVLPHGGAAKLLASTHADRRPDGRLRPDEGQVVELGAA